ncbi:dynamin family protein [Marinicrinis sediminis]|uniref:Dynamin family protein n=1 Tax=Marinicrinis sediminis TaxID=1652465 RepID=A0ABW5RD70_9BACL
MTDATLMAKHAIQDLKDTYVQLQSDMQTDMTTIPHEVEEGERERLSSVIQRLGQLQDRFADDQQPLNIALCGHFSAGKSTLINGLVGENLLPSSPIPTSANLVRVQYGQTSSSVTLHRRDGSTAHAAIQDLAEACRDGAAIERVDIEVPSPLLKKGLSFLDTPGVDSTDPAHYAATYEAIHLADLVLFVCDYNHVQSETNFQFLKQLESWSKPCLFVVNQIDKHDDRELPFSRFDQSVRSSLQEWDTQAAAIYYVSKQSNAIRNQRNELIEALGQLASERDAMRVSLLAGSVAGMIEQYSEEKKQVLTRLFTRQQDPDYDELAVEQAREERQQLLVEQNKWQGAQHAWFVRNKKELNAILENANIIPAATRELMHAFIESRADGFRAGWLFGKSKTEKEQEVRLTQLTEDMQEQVRIHIDKHVRELWRGIEQETGSSRDWEIDITSDLWFSILQPGAIASSAYTLTFASLASEQIKGLYRRTLLPLLEALSEEIGEQAAQAQSRIEERLHQLQEILRWEDRLDEELVRLEDQRRAWMDPFTVFQENDTLQQLTQIDAPVDHDMALDHAVAPDSSPAAARLPHPGSSRKRMNGTGTETRTKLSKDGATMASLRKMGTEIAAIAGKLEAVQGFEGWMKQLHERAERLTHQSFTVALFGAFSAGKSSFANALLGDRVLPVSPSPTTASVIRIQQTTGQMASLDACIHMKSREQLEQEMFDSLDILGIKENSLERAFEAIAERSRHQLPAKAKMHLSFLQAVRSGWDTQSAFLGQMRKVTYDQYVQYAAEETYSCFVNEIDLYVDCPLTESGIVLVDTPGADSIHARHTGVAFQYMKSADAVLFVTYYHHAFSQADRDFLRQMSQVSHLSELKHLFFVINAADLAQSSEELDEVKTYVYKQLQQCEIQEPKLFALSSRHAIEAWQEGDEEKMKQSGLPDFEADFHPFVLHELPEIMRQSTRDQLHRLNATIASYIEEQTGSKEERIAGIASNRESMQQWMQTYRAREEEGRHRQEEIRDEVQELLYYVRQRAVFRYHDHFHEAFHPSILHQQTVDLKSSLWMCWKDLLRELNTYLQREMQTFELRMEVKLNEALREVQTHVHTEAQKLSVSAPVLELSLNWEGLSNSVKLSDDVIQVKELQRQYKNPKHFFEGSGKETLKQELAPKVEEAIQTWLKDYEQQVIPSLDGQYQSTLTTWLDQYMEHWEHHLNGRLTAIHSAESGHLLREISQSLSTDKR